MIEPERAKTNPLRGLAIRRRKCKNKPTFFQCLSAIVISDVTRKRALQDNANLGTDCLGSNATCIGSDLNRDGKVNDSDLRLLNAAFGKSCAPCGADLNGDGVVNRLGRNIMLKASRPALIAPRRGRVIL